MPFTLGRGWEVAKRGQTMTRVAQIHDLPTHPSSICTTVQNWTAVYTLRSWHPDKIDLHEDIHWSSNCTDGHGGGQYSSLKLWNRWVTLKGKASWRHRVRDHDSVLPRSHLRDTFGQLQLLAVISTLIVTGSHFYHKDWYFMCQAVPK